VVINEEVSDDFVSMGSGEVHCASHVERPAGVQRHESKARRSTWLSVIDFRCHRPIYLRRVSSSDVSRRRVWEDVDDITALQLFSDVSKRGNW
jgi:hypothetical protein